ncbi:Uncharacterised protein [Vibrio cholerae]|nr:Uncharacterised protein [Vibrio cholerae]
MIATSQYRNPCADWLTGNTNRVVHNEFLSRYFVVVRLIHSHSSGIPKLMMLIL